LDAKLDGVAAQQVRKPATHQQRSCAVEGSALAYRGMLSPMRYSPMLLCLGLALSCGDKGDGSDEAGLGGASGNDSSSRAGNDGNSGSGATRAGSGNSAAGHDGAGGNVSSAGGSNTGGGSNATGGSNAAGGVNAGGRSNAAGSNAGGQSNTAGSNAGGQSNTAGSNAGGRSNTAGSNAGGRSNTAGSNPGGQSNTGGSNAAGADSYGDARIRCVDRTNALRATKGLPPIPRLASAEPCVDGQAKADSESGKAHTAFDACLSQVKNWKGAAQNECPGYASVESTLGACLDMMWAEGPGGGHYDNMVGGSTRTACGFYTTPQGKVWMVQDFWTE
jgi:hypothetical protein